LPVAGLLVSGGRLGDLLGRRRVFVLGAVLFAGASAVGSLAPAMPLLLAARVAQVWVVRSCCRRRARSSA